MSTNLIRNLCEDIERGYAAELSGFDDWMIEKLQDLGDSTEDILKLCDERDKLLAALKEAQRELAWVSIARVLDTIDETPPRRVPRIQHPLPPGTRLTSIGGEMDTADDDESDRCTGPMAVGEIRRVSHYSDQGWSYSVTFENGTWVHIDEAEINDPTQYTIHTKES